MLTLAQTWFLLKEPDSVSRFPVNKRFQHFMPKMNSVSRTYPSICSTSHSESIFFSEVLAWKLDKCHMFSMPLSKFILNKCTLVLFNKINQEKSIQKQFSASLKLKIYRKVDTCQNRMRLWANADVTSWYCFIWQQFFDHWSTVIYVQLVNFWYFV